MSLFNSIKKLRPLLLTVTALLCLAAPAQAFGPDLFNVEGFSAGITDQAGHDYTLAGGHPFEASTSFSFPSIPSPLGPQPLEEVKSVFTELPPGVVGNVAAAQRCPFAKLQGFFITCPPASAVGIVTLTTTSPFSLALY